MLKLKVWFLKRKGWVEGYKVVLRQFSELMSSHAHPRLTYGIGEITKRERKIINGSLYKDGALAVYDNREDAHRFARKHNTGYGFFMKQPYVINNLHVYKCLYKKSECHTYHRFCEGNQAIKIRCQQSPSGKDYADEVMLVEIDRSSTK